jgi:penicillin-binding protein 1A
MPAKRKPTNGRGGGRSGAPRIPTPLKFLIGLGAALAIFAGLFAWGLYYFLTYDLPPLTSLKDYAGTVPVISTVYADDGHVIGEFFKERRRYVPIERMPRMLVNAFVAAEDQRFFEHEGLDYLGIVRAFVNNLRAADAQQGGSTLTQQVARTFFLSREKSYIRKVKEAILATRMEHFLSKAEILNLYMNHIYLGHGAYGVEAAAENYFGKTVHQLNLAEMALIAAMPKAPSRLNPFANVNRAVARQRYVLGRMVDSEFISEDQAEAAKRTRLIVNPRPNPSLEEAPYFTEMLRRYLIEQYGAERVYEGGLEVYTTLNRADQRAAERALARGLRELDRRQGYRGPLGRVEPDQLGAYLVALDRNERRRKDGALEGVVTAIARDGKSATVRTGMERHGTLRVEDMAWARKPDPERPPSTIASVKEALRVGDIVLVRPRGSEPKPEDPGAAGASEPLSGVKALREARARAKAGDAEGVARDPASGPYELDQVPEVQGALISVETRTGHVKAWVGGSDFARSQFDRAYQGHRQPGSSFKPIIYAAALDRGFTPTTIVVDSPISFRDTAGNVWAPKNYDEEFHGPVTVREALAESRNVPTVKILERVGVKYVIKYARRLGISSPLGKNLSLALGSGEVTLFELTRAFGVFAGQGKRMRPVFIRKIVNRDGQIIAVNRRVPDPSPGRAAAEAREEEKDPADEAEDPLIKQAAANPDDFPPGNVISRSTAYQITDLLQGAVQYGTGRRVKALGRPAAGKTGTTNDLRDAWFIGFTPQLIAGVWVGFDQEKPLGYKETGGRAAAPIWLYYMEKALEGEPVQDFDVPRTISFARVNYNTGRPAGEGDGGKTIFEAFKEGQEPRPPSSLVEGDPYYANNPGGVPPGGVAPGDVSSNVSPNMQPGAPPERPQGSPGAAPPPPPPPPRDPLAPPPVDFFKYDYDR